MAAGHLCSRISGRNPCKGQNRYAGRSDSQQGSRRRLHGRPGRIDIVDQQHGPAEQVGFCRGRDEKGTAHVFKSRRRAQTHLGPCRLFAHQCSGQVGQFGLPGQNAGQFSRLVVTAGQKPAPMQRNGDEAIGLRHQFVTRSGHPLHHEGRKICPVLVFEPVNDGAGDIIIKHCGARPAKRRRVGNRIGADQRIAHIMGERCSQNIAIGFFNLPQAAPACPAHAAMHAGEFAASGADRRIDPAANHGAAAAQTGAD